MGLAVIATPDDFYPAIAGLALDDETSVSRFIAATLVAVDKRLESSVEKEPSTRQFEFSRVERTDSGEEHIYFWLEFLNATDPLLRPCEIVLTRNPLTVTLRIADRQHDVQHSSLRAPVCQDELQWARAIFVAFEP